MIKITGGQRIDLLGVRKEDLPGVWADLDMPSGYAYGKSFRTVKTCVGTDFCRFGLGDSTTLAVASSRRYQGLESPAKMKLAVAGCPRNCSEALVKDVGVVAVGDDRWDVLIGGAAGASVRRGDVLATVDGHDEVVRLVRGVHAVLPGERPVAGAHVRLRAAGRARRAQGDPGRRPRRHRRRPGGADAGRRRRLPRPLAGRARALGAGPVREQPAAAPAADRAGAAGHPTGACRRRRRAAARRRADRSRAEREPCRTTRGRRHDHVRDHGPCGRGERRAAARASARAFAVGDTMVAVFRLRSGELRAIDAVCPHSGGPLADGQFDTKKVICPLHNYFFSLADGTCTNGDYAVRTYPVREEARQDRRRRRRVGAPKLRASRYRLARECCVRGRPAVRPPRQRDRSGLERPLRRRRVAAPPPPS